MFDYELLGASLPSLVDEAHDLFKLDNYEKQAIMLLKVALQFI